MNEPPASTFAILIALRNRSRSLLWAIHAEHCRRSCQIADSVGETLALLAAEQFQLLIVGDDFHDGRARQVIDVARALTPRPRIFGVLQADSQKYRSGFDEGSVDELIAVASPLSHIERLWNIWLGPS
jgi:hypothetical protein